MRPLVLGLALLFLVPALATAQAPAHDHEGDILVGSGRLALVQGRDHVLVYSPVDAVGFDFSGDIRYDVRTFSYGSGLVREVKVMAPLGARDVHFTLDWVVDESVTPTVAFGLPPAKPTNCVDLLCFQ